ncbi:MAG: 6-hydroxymethylpterin diphosphokinase MptE-like protein [Desulfurococcaceae archaeon]
MSWVISREEWIRVYNYITTHLPELNFARDQLATDILSAIISKHRSVLPLEEFLEDLRGFDLAVVVGCSESLYKDLATLGKLTARNDGVLLVAADGAVSALLEHGFVPHLVVSDLDGDFNSIKKASSMGSIVVTHAHGDNISKLRRVLELEGPVIGSTQVEPRPHVHNFGGFTDGDRALYILYHAGYRRIILAGFNFDEPHVCPGKVVVDYAVKKKKLDVAKWLISLLEDKGLQVVNTREL